jgi:hypothetical protein
MASVFDVISAYRLPITIDIVKVFEKFCIAIGTSADGIGAISTSMPNLESGTTRLSKKKRWGVWQAIFYMEISMTM